MAVKSGTYVKFQREERAQIGKFEFNSGIVSAVRHLVNKYPRFCRSSRKNVRNQYKGSLKTEKQIVKVQSSGTQNTARMYQQKRIVRKAHKGSYMKFSEADRDIIAKAVIEVGAPAALQKFKPFFPRLRESTCRYLRDRYIKSLGLNPKDLKSCNIQVSPSASQTRQLENNNLSSTEAEDNKVDDFHSQSDTSITGMKSPECAQTTSTSYTVLSSRDHLPSNDINNSAGNYENFNQRNLRNDAENTSKGHLPVHMSGSRSMIGGTMRISKGKYNKFCKEEKEFIGKYAYTHGTMKAMRQLRDKYPQLRESTCRHLRDKYSASLKEGRKEQMQPPTQVPTGNEGENHSGSSTPNFDNPSMSGHEDDDFSGEAVSYSSTESFGDDGNGEIVTVLTKEHEIPQEFQEVQPGNGSYNEEKGFNISSSKKRGQYNKYDEDDRCEIGMFASQHGIVSTLRHFKDRFPNLNESTCRNFRDRYNVIVGVEGANDVSEFDPVSFVDVYSNVKLSDNSEGILTKPSKTDEQRGDNSSVGQEGARRNFAVEQGLTKGTPTSRVPGATFSTVGRGEQHYEVYPQGSAPRRPGEEIYGSPDMHVTPTSSYEMHNSYSDGTGKFDDFDDPKRRASTPGSQKAKVKRGSYCKFNEDSKIEIGKFASRYGVSRTYMHFQPKYPRLKESTCRYFKELYEKELKWKDTKPQEPEPLANAGPKIVIRPASHFDRNRKPIVVKVPRGLHTIPNRFISPSAAVPHQHSTPYNLERMRPEQSNEPSNTPKVNQDQFSFSRPSTELHISNVESLHGGPAKELQPGHIKLEDESETRSPPITQVTMDPNQREVSHSANYIQSINTREPSPYSGNGDVTDHGRPRYSEIDLSSEETLPPSYLHNNREKSGRIEAARYAANYQQMNGGNSRKSTRVTRYVRPDSERHTPVHDEAFTDERGQSRKTKVTAEDAEASIVKFLRLLHAEGGDIGVSSALSIARGVIESRNKHLLSEYGGGVTLTKGWIKAIISRHSLNSETTYC